MVHESAKHALEQRKKYAAWLDAADAAVVANAMLIIIGRALNMLKSQIEAQGKAFEETGGFRERLTARRIEARGKGKPPAPQCPRVRQADAPAELRQGRVLGLLHVPGVQGNEADMRGRRSEGREGPY